MERPGIILSTMRFSERPVGDFFRTETLFAIRKFAIINDDMELEAQCDEQLEVESK